MTKELLPRNKMHVRYYNKLLPSFSIKIITPGLLYFKEISCHLESYFLAYSQSTPFFFKRYKEKINCHYALKT